MDARAECSEATGAMQASRPQDARMRRLPSDADRTLETSCADPPAFADCSLLHNGRPDWHGARGLNLDARWWRAWGNSRLWIQPSHFPLSFGARHTSDAPADAALTPR